jgi:2-amino-4-hydroxy-6-hydroxymethyldihydropteridine diphosphokinase
MAEVYLSLGSNQGDKKAFLDFAIEELGRDMEILAVSSVYQTPPFGGVPQSDFLNLVLWGRTELLPHELLARIHQIEAKAGRKRTIRWGPRTLDIDILTYDERQIQSPELIVPHIGIPERAFVLAPWAEIAPNMLVPGLAQTVAELLAALPETEKTGVKKILIDRQ